MFLVLTIIVFSCLPHLESLVTLKTLVTPALYSPCLSDDRNSFSLFALYMYFYRLPRVSSLNCRTFPLHFSLLMPLLLWRSSSHFYSVLFCLLRTSVSISQSPSFSFSVNVSLCLLVQVCPSLRIWETMSSWLCPPDTNFSSLASKLVLVVGSRSWYILFVSSSSLLERMFVFFTVSCCSGLFLFYTHRTLLTTWQQEEFKQRL